MRTKSLLFAAVIGVAALPALAQAPLSDVQDAKQDVQQDVKVVYPTTATDVAELDSSTPAKRAEPPVRETNEFDPTTPIGQIRRVLETLDKLEADNATLQARLQGLEKLDALIPLLEKDSQRAEALTANVENLLQSSRLMGGKIDDLKQTTENLRATVEAVQKTAASIESIRQSRWTDYAVLAILAIVLIQLSYRVIVGGYKKIKIIAKALEVANNAIQTELREAKTTVKKAVKE
jgi:hypothetical protein